MPGTITALRLHGRHRQRVEVYLDGERAFSLTLLEAARLRRGQTLSDEEIAALRERNAREEAHEDALRYLRYRARSAAEVERYLLGRGHSPDVVAAEVQRLRESGLIDDAEFARAWVEERERLRPRAPHALRQELRQKGLDEETIAQAIAGVDAEASAYKAARARAARLSDLDYAQFRRRLGGFLARRGFDYQVTYKVIARLWQEQRGAAPPQADDEESS